MSAVIADQDTEFDTSGTGRRFCPECEHEPCVAGGNRFCTMRPRFIVTWAMRTETADLLVRVGDPSNQLLDPLYSAVRALAQAAYGQGIYADDALEGLAEIRGKLRALR